VMDEVHYLADRSRGAVWEEVIIHLPESVAVVSLSATVSNAEEFGDWLSTVRGSNDIVVEERRPVPLFQHVMVGSRLYDLFSDTDEPLADGSTAVNPRLTQVARDDWRSSRTRDHRTKRGQYRRPTGRALVPSRTDVVERLDAEALLPAIMFIFSRKGCDAAVQQCLRANLRLTTAAERSEIRAFVEARTSVLPGSDLEVLGYPEWAEALTRGISSHHAGMLPIFKECVEELFSQGLGKVVFATETLALGINMPARSVVIDKLSKWNGETHADMTPGEYTQLTGRAGRRGIDVEGHAVVLGAGLRPQGRRGPGVHPYVSAALVVSAVVQHGSQPRPPIREGHRPGAARVVLRPVPGRSRGRRARPPGTQGRGGPRGVRRLDRLRQGRLHGVRGAPPGLVGPGGDAVEAPP
jgi:ATP-dependent RNA helicase HelY